MQKFAPTETERLLIRDWTLDDAEAAFAIYSDPEVCRFIRPQGPQESVEQQRLDLENALAKYAEMSSGYGFWALVEKESDRIAGTVMLKPLPGHDEIEVGWHLGRFAWGKGYATESAIAALDFGFKVLGLNRIVAVIDPLNDRSQAVAGRLGMDHEGLIRAYDHDLYIYSLTQEQWAARRVE